MATVFDLDADAAVELWWEGVVVGSILVALLEFWLWRVGYPSFEFGVCGIG